MTSLPVPSGITCGLKVTLPPTMPNGERRPRRTRWSGNRTLSRTWWFVGTVRSTTSALWASAGTRCPTSWSWTHRYVCGNLTSLLIMLVRTPPNPDQTLILFPAGVRPDGPPQRLHDPHATRSQLRHLQVPLQFQLSKLSEHPEGRVPPGPVQEVRLGRAQVPHRPEEHLKRRSFKDLRMFPEVLSDRWRTNGSRVALFKELWTTCADNRGFLMTLRATAQCLQEVEPVERGEGPVWQEEGPVEQEEEPSLISFHLTDIFHIFFLLSIGTNE